MHDCERKEHVVVVSWHTATERHQPTSSSQSSISWHTRTERCQPTNNSNSKTCTVIAKTVILVVEVVVFCFVDCI
jgi:hypothetical protein